ncbi:MAG TPA: T9SS type A sorting domain-containing protein, partial [Caldithrix abyssi]|nr:T9SS type A sorting domain-containing protein [Caldithrix abyssi]
SKLPFIFSVACVNGAFDDGDCFAEAWLRKENGGAVMFLGSTINQPWAPPMRGQDYFNDILIGGYNYDDHPGQNGINTNEQRTFIGSIVINGFALMLNESNTSSDVETIQTWCIFGDPSLQVRTAAPAPLSLSNEEIVAGTPFTTTITSNGSPVVGAMVCISQNDKYYSAITDANGEVSIEHDFQDGQALLVVTAFNTETIYEQKPVGSGDGPHVVVDRYEVNHLVEGVEDEVEYKEEFYLDVSAKNIGNQPAVDVQSLLSSQDEYIEIIDNDYFYGTIDTAQLVDGPQAFFLKALDGTPDQHVVTCTVTFSDTSNAQWNSDITITVNAPDLQNDGLTINDDAQGDGDGVIDPGETADFDIPLYNQGHAASEAGKATLTTNSPYLTIQTDSIAVPILYVQDTMICSYSVVASADAPEGEKAELYYTAQCGAYSCTDTFEINIGGKAVFLMQNGTFEVTDAYFYDSGGKDGNYGTSENFTMTFLPADRATVKVVFHSFSTVANYDKLYIYDGPDDSYPQVPGSPFSSDENPGEIEATNSEGALTFKFRSNPIIGGTGWEADIYTTGVSEIAADNNRIIKEFSLLPNFPNPFNPQTTIRYQLAEKAPVQVNIYNLLGQKVRQLFHGTQNRGLHQIVWNGKDQAGHTLSSGIYIVQVQAGQNTARQKILLVK